MVKVGDTIRIILMKNEPKYTGREGVVQQIDAIGQLHGSWGGCALIPGIDAFEVLRKERTTQTKELVKHLKKYGSITSMEAFKLYGITRLAALVFNLRKAGYKIDTIDMASTNRYGSAVRYAKYVYREEE